MSPLVDSLLDSVAEALAAGERERLPALPDRAAVLGIVENLRAVLFPAHFGPAGLEGDALRRFVGDTLESVARDLEDQLARVLPPGPRDAAAVTREFLAQLPGLRLLLALDVQAAWEGDPAAPSPDETILCYPGVAAITHHRIAHALHHLGVPLIPRLISEHAHSTTGIDIHPGASIGERFFIDHGTGVVIGETAVIGARVRLYQGVTLGAKSFPLDSQGNPLKGIPRHPIVEDDVVIYSGATVLGRITVGRRSVIGGNVWVTRSVPPGTHVTQAVAGREAWAEGGGI